MPSSPFIRAAFAVPLTIGLVAAGSLSATAAPVIENSWADLGGAINPSDIEPDAFGNLYLIDNRPDRSAIVKVDSTGAVNRDYVTLDPGIRPNLLTVLPHGTMVATAEDSRLEHVVRILPSGEVSLTPLPAGWDVRDITSDRRGNSYIVSRVKEGDRTYSAVSKMSATGDLRLDYAVLSTPSADRGTVSPAGELFVLDDQGSIVRVEPGGITTFASVPHRNAYEQGLIVDHRGNLFATTGNYVHMVAPDGSVSLAADLSNVGRVTGQLAVDSRDTVFVGGFGHMTEITPGGGVGTLRMEANQMGLIATDKIAVLSSDGTAMNTVDFSNLSPSVSYPREVRMNVRDTVTVAHSTFAISGTYRVVAGSMPRGFSLNSQTGLLGGPAYESGTFTFTIEVAGLGGSARSDVTVIVRDGRSRY